MNSGEKYDKMDDQTEQQVNVDKKRQNFSIELSDRNESGMGMNRMSGNYSHDPTPHYSPKRDRRSLSFTLKKEADSASRKLKAEKGWPNARCILITLLLILVASILGVMIYFYGGTVVGGALSIIIAFFEYLHGFQEPYRSGIFFLTSYGLQVFGAPISSLLITLVAYCVRDFLHGFLISYPVSLCANITLYFVFRKTESQYEGVDETFLMEDDRMTFVEFMGLLMKDFIANYPYRFGLGLRTLHLPDYAKMYILVKYNTTFKQMIVPCILIEALNITLYSFIGSQVQSKFDLISPKSFSEKSIGEQIVTVSAVLLVIMQIVVLIAGFIYTKRKYAEYENTGRLQVTPRLSSIKKVQNI